MRLKFATVFRHIGSVAIAGAIASIFVFILSSREADRTINTMLTHYTSNMQKHISQKWFKTALKFRATYSAERQLSDFADDFFEKGFIHEKDAIIGGFGYELGDAVPETSVTTGLFRAGEELFYRVPVDKEIAVTFQINQRFVKKFFPTISDLKPGEGTPLAVKIGWLPAMLHNLGLVFSIFLTLLAIGYGSSISTRYVGKIRQENDQKDRQNHDLRASSFNYRVISYWMQKFMASANAANKEALTNELQGADVSYEINNRIFKTAKVMESQNFSLHHEITKILGFVGQEMALDQFQYAPCNPSLIVRGNLNAFTVLLINIVKNALREVASKPGKHCELEVLEGPDYVEVLVINDGVIEKPKQILRNRRSFRGSTGLGLTIARRQEDALMTKVSLRSLPSKAKVICSFPLTKRLE